MPTFIKAGFWEKAKKGYSHWLNLDELITSLIPVTPLGNQLVKVEKTIISTAQVLDLFTTPITILNSDDPLTIKYPLNVYIKRNSGTAYTLAANQFYVKNYFGVLLSNINPNPLTSGQEGYMQYQILTSQNSSGPIKNNLYKLSANTGNPTLGTGDLDVYVTYVEITI